jgi:DNA (cytosine-5)-methyltransferase 1
MRLGSLFAGIGGFDLAARWMGWETAWFSEIDPYASAVLAKHWPGVPNHGDITRIDFTQVEPVDLLCGGFPCQDISSAGKRAGIDGGQSGLWREYARAIGELRPRYVVVENTRDLLVRGMDRVLRDLASLGYDAEWTVLSASEVGAAHRRDRVWVLAYPQSGRVEGERLPTEGEISLAHPHRGRKKVADADRQPTLRAAIAWQECPAWEREPAVARVAHGIPSRLDRLACLGNAIVPQCALVIFQAIQAREEAMREVA